MIACSLLLLFCLTLTFPCLAKTESKVIRVGFPIQEGLTQLDEEGNYSGYTYEYLQEIAQYTGWEYEFVLIPGDLNESLTTLMEMLEEGRIDILGATVKNDATMELYDFPEYSYGTSYTTLSVLEDNDRINDTNYQSLSGLRIAVMSTAKMRIEALKNFCTVNNISYELVPCRNEDELLDSLEDGRADAMLGVDLSHFPGTRTVAKFNGTKYYFATTKGNTEILNTLNSAIGSIKELKPYFEAELYDKYFDYGGGSYILSEEERAYIQEAEPLRVAIVPGIMPIQDIGEKQEPLGVAQSILEKVAEETGLQFTYVTAKSFPDAYRLIDDGKADILSAIPYDYDLAIQHGMIMTSSFLSSPMAAITKSNQHINSFDGQRIGVVAGRKMPDTSGVKSVIQYNTPLECVDAVARGDVDCGYMNLYSAEYLLNQYQYRSLRLLLQGTDSSDFCLGIKKPADLRLISIFNKVIGSLSDQDVTTLVLQSTAISNSKISIASMIEQNPIAAVVALILFFTLILVVVIVINRSRVKSSRQIDLEHKRYLQLSDLANEYIYEYDREHDRLTLSKQFAELFGLPLSVEHFKRDMGTDGDPSEVLQFFRTHPEVEADEEHQFRLADGEMKWFRNIRAEIPDQSGKVVYVIGKLVDIQREIDQREMLVEKSQKDGLTGIYNATSCRNLIGKRLKVLEQPGALLIIDIDHFKAVNDELGHYLGDIVLQDFAKLLTASFRRNDLAGRLGGDEFLVYMDPANSRDAVIKKCETLCAAARRTYTNGEKRHDITISIGAAQATEPGNFDALYQEADKALYQAKAQGRNGFVLSKTEKEEI